jgi:hypothetical protein
MWRNTQVPTLMGSCGAASASVTARRVVITLLASESVGRRVTKGILTTRGSVFSRGDASGSKRTASLLPGAAVKMRVTFGRWSFHERSVSRTSFLRAA